VRNVDQSTRDTIEDVAVRLATDPHANVRGLAVPILRNVEDRRGLDALTQMTSDSDWFVRKSAARALASLGDPGAEVLRRLAVGSDRFAAERAREELALVAAGHQHHGVPS
jgi:HEAT repeat protein